MTETEIALRNKAESFGANPNELIKDICQDPDWFFCEGGSDGTFSHLVWLEDYGVYQPELGKFVVEYLQKEQR